MAESRSISYYRRNRQEWIDYLGGKCAICGTTENLEIDHVERATKEFNLSKYRGRAANFKELDKCQLLCKFHHLEKTSRESRKDRSLCHGTISQYQIYKCRCELCRDAQRIWKRNLRIRNGESVGDRGPYKKNTEHGTQGFYRKGCRCDICKAWNRDKKRKDREKKLSI